MLGHARDGRLGGAFLGVVEEQTPTEQVRRLAQPARELWATDRKHHEHLKSVAACRTMYDMSTILTVRTDKSLREALARKAKAEHKTISEVVREILEEALVERPLAERVGKLRGELHLPEPPTAWQREIRDRNWRR